MNVHNFPIFIASAALAAFLAFPLYAADVTVTENPAEAEPVPAETAQQVEAAFARKLGASLRGGSTKDALAVFAGMPDSLKGDADLQKVHVSLLISSGGYSEATKIITELEGKNPADIEIKEMKMLLAKASGNTQAKRAVIKEIIKLDPNNSPANTELAQEQVLARKYIPARNTFLKALKGNPKNLDALFGLGQTSYYVDDLKTARTAFNKMLKVDPNNALAYSYIAKLYAEEENYALAEENIQKAIKLDSSNYNFYMDLGTYQRTRGKYKDAEKAWSAAIKIDPKYFLGYAYRAGLYDEQNMYDEALADYRMVVKTNPKYYFAYESLGILAWRIGNYDEARAAFEKAYATNAKNVSYPLMIAACYYMAQQPVKAAAQVKPFLAKAMKAYPDHNSTEYLMLRLYNDLGPVNAENIVTQKVQAETDSNKKGKMSFYLALYEEIKGRRETATKIYAEVASLQTPMFFEFRMAEWKVQ